jgi:hypothetical protein
MGNEFEQVAIDFNTKARRSFFLSYERFAVSAKKLDREKEENVFQHLLAKYIHDLKIQLENLATELLHKNKSVANSSQLNSIFQSKIIDYLNEFRQKSNSH